MALRHFLLLLNLFLYLITAAQTKDSPPNLPESNIELPIIVDLRPFFAMTEKQVPQVFTSPNYPRDWVQADCATRYKYHFRRSPFRMKMTGNRLDLGFTGSYKITGSTRACLNGKVLSPWTPSCNCGFEEEDRKVDVSFTSFFNLRQNYLLSTRIIRNEPRPLNNCEVCFWGQDVTASVLKGLKAELDLSAQAMQKEFGMLDLKPYMADAWNSLSAVHAVPGLGFFSLNPKKIRMENLNGANDFLRINIGITASPVISFQNNAEAPAPLPNISGSTGKPGFNIYLEAALQYDSLSHILNGALKNKRFEISEGFIKKHIIVDSAAVSGGKNDNLLVSLKFSGSFIGMVFFTGMPVYDPVTKKIEVANLDYELHSKNILLKTAKWLFNRKIKDELRQYTQFSMSDYYDTAGKAIQQQMNKEWMKGVKSFGQVNNIELISVQALPDHLLIKSNCEGKLGFVVSNIDMGFSY